MLFLLDPNYRTFLPFFAQKLGGMHPPQKNWAQKLGGMHPPHPPRGWRPWKRNIYFESPLRVRQNLNRYKIWKENTDGQALMASQISKTF